MYKDNYLQLKRQYYEIRARRGGMEASTSTAVYPFAESSYRQMMIYSMGDSLTKTQEKLISIGDDLNGRINVVSVEGATGQGKTTGTLCAFGQKFKRGDKIVIFKVQNDSLNKEIQKKIKEMYVGVNIYDVKLRETDELGFENNILKSDVILTDLSSLDLVLDFLAKTLPYPNTLWMLWDEYAQYFHARNMNERENNPLMKVSKALESLSTIDTYVKIYALSAVANFSSKVPGANDFTGEYMPSQVLKFVFEDTFEVLVAKDPNNLVIKSINADVDDSELGVRPVKLHSYILHLTNAFAEKVGGTFSIEGKTYIKYFEPYLDVLFANVNPHFRSLVCCRRTQAEAIREKFSEKVLRFGRQFLFTDDITQFEDERYRFLIVYDDEYAQLEGRNITNLKSVYILNLGNEHETPKLIQVIGRVGRLDQSFSHVFIFTGESEGRGGKTDRATLPILLEKLREKVLRADYETPTIKYDYNPDMTEEELEVMLSRRVSTLPEHRLIPNLEDGKKAYEELKSTVLRTVLCPFGIKCRSFQNWVVRSTNTPNLGSIDSVKRLTPKELNRLHSEWINLPRKDRKETCKFTHLHDVKTVDYTKYRVYGTDDGKFYFHKKVGQRLFTRKTERRSDSRGDVRDRDSIPKSSRELDATDLRPVSKTNSDGFKSSKPKTHHKNYKKY